MTHVALIFKDPQHDTIEVFLSLCKRISEALPMFRYSLVLPEVEVPAFLNREPGIGVVSIKDFRVLGLKGRFTTVVQCPARLKEGPLAERQAEAFQSLVRTAGLDTLNDPILNPLDDGLVFEGPFNPVDGYGASAEQLLLALNRLGVPLSFIPAYYESAHMADPQLHRLAEIQATDRRHYLLYHPPGVTLAYHQAARATKNLFTMFEATGIPTGWKEVINEAYHRLIVPSRFCKDVFGACGVEIPISVVPLGTNTRLWPVIDRSKRDKPFEFLLLANAHWENGRKNYAECLGAFMAAFAGKKDVRLTLKMTFGFQGPRPHLSDNVDIVVGRLSQPDVLRLMHRADCFLFPTAGEGFGLPPREAMCTGLPTVITDWGALAELYDPRINYSISCVGYRDFWFPTPGKAGGEIVGQLAEISVDELAAVMSYIYEHRQEAFTKGKIAAEWIRKNETYDLSALKLSQALGIEVPGKT